MKQVNSVGEQQPLSYYFASARMLHEYPSLESTTDCDICVVGGGFTGINTALELVGRGYSVVLLEAQSIGWGASGRNGGQVLRGLGYDLGRFTRYIGDSGVETLEKMGIEALQLVHERIRDHDIQCDWQSGFCDVANHPRHYQQFEQEQAHWQRLGYPWPLQRITRRDLHTIVGSDRYHGGLFDPGSGHLQPLDLLQAEAALAARQGARLFEHSPVQELIEGSPHILRTERGEVRAQCLVLCANAHVHGLHRHLARRVLPAGSHILATAPLTEAEASRALPRNSAICDQQIALDYFRLSADRRLLFGGLCHYSGRNPSDLIKVLKPRLERVFPWLSAKPVDYAWSGMIGIGANRCPQIGRLRPDFYYAQAYSGHGLNVSHLAARLIAEHIHGESQRLELFEQIPHRAFPGGTWLAPWLLATGMAWHRLRERWSV